MSVGEGEAESNSEDEIGAEVVEMSAFYDARCDSIATLL